VTTTVTPAVRADIAPNGRIRAGINYGNAILAQKDEASGESSGVAIDLAREIAGRLTVPVEFVAFETAGALVDGATSGAWDIAFLGSEPAREKVMSFTPAYLEIEATYLVPRDSTLQTASEADRDGVTVAAPARANYQLFLERTLQRAKLTIASNGTEAVELLTSGQVDALAGLKEGLIGLAERLDNVRMLDGRFMAVQQSIGVAKGHDAGLAFLTSVVEEAKASGMVARAIEKTGARGVSVAPQLDSTDTGSL
jgi:polar amino acid transport system substrate-binding protein